VKNGSTLGGEAGRLVSMFRVVFGRSSHQALTSSLGMTLATGALGKFATVLLVPMLFLQPLLPLYAADESVAPAESAPAAEVPPPPPPEPAVETPADSEEAAPAPEEAPVETPLAESTPEETPSEEVSDTEVPSETSETNEEINEKGSDEEIPPTEDEAPDTAVDGEESNEEQDGEVAGDATTTPEVVDVLEVQAPVASGSGGGGGGNQSPHPNPLPEGEGATTTDEVVPSNEVSEEGEVASEEIAEETAEETDSEVAAEAIDPAVEAEAVAARAEAERQSELVKQKAAHDALRKEVEAEITKGCLTIDGVGYYCLKNFEGSVSSSATTTKVTSIQSLQDSSGSDKEIFITRDGESIQLTQNSWDDTFPAMDVTGKSLVWQGMVEGRWQIFFADVSGTSSPIITQLTHSSESNFNPRVDGNTVVWQGWVSGNWEIFLADHLSPSSYYPDGEEDILPSENRRLGINGEWHVSRLSENDTHDMFPAISGGLVTWQSFQEGSWNVYAYNMKTGESTQLSQGGVKSENPRFAVTWDERDANGNTRMVGYDIASGKTIDLTQAARHTPNNPNPYQPDAPLSQPNQAALPPAGSSGSSTPARADGDDEGGTNGLEI
jgi:beta propeller repeat protein